MFKHKHNKMFCMTFFFIAVLSIVFLFAVTDASARPASSALHTLTQPDGYTFQARLWGDEYYHGWETEDGYTIILDESSKTWFYAVNDAEGNPVSSQYTVGAAAPPEDLKKHLRITGDALSRIQQQRMKRQPLSLDDLSVREPMAPKTGTNNVLTLLMNFSDTTSTVTKSQFEDLYFKKGNNSITDYYLENSYEKLTVTSEPGKVQDWWRASNTHDYYGADDKDSPNINDVKLPEAVLDLVKYWDGKDFDFAPYSQSGDCFVDTVAIIVQGNPQSSTGVVTDIWPKQNQLDPPYETKKACDGSPNVKIKVKKYTIQTEFEYDPATKTSSMATIGTFAHEYGHALGLPDLYDVSYVSKGSGNWATMASGCDNKADGGKGGDRPAHHDAWSKFYLGWIAPVQVASTLVNLTIPAVEDASKVYQLLSGTPESGEYFLIENRQKKKFDAGLPGAGLLIWHIDGKVTKDNSISINNKVNAMPCNNGTPCSVQHYGVALQQADGLWHLEKNSNNGDAGDPYPGSANNISFNDNASPDSRLYNYTTSDVSVTNISASGENIIATLSVPTTASPYQWQWREPLPQGNTLESTSFGKNSFVSVGGGGTVITSPDGVTWTKRESGTTGDLKNVLCTNDANCIAVGADGIFRISSDDGITWKTVNTETQAALYGAAVGGAGNDQLVVAGATGTIIYTKDINADNPFKTAITPVFYNLYGVTYGNKLFVAVGGLGTIITSDASPNASTWTKQTSGTESDLRSIIVISIGGVNKFYAVGSGGTILTSSNGTLWTKQISGTTNDLINISISNNTLIAVGGGGTVITSPDGVTWTKRESGTTDNLSGAAYGNNAFVAIGNSGVILTSSNGTAWTARSSGSTANISGAAYGNNTFVVVGAGGAILTSPDGASWMSRTSGTTFGLSRVGYGNYTFVTVGGFGTILTSFDGVTWTKRESGAVLNVLYDITYGNGTFVAVGDTGIGSTGTILTSSDGVTWTARDSKTTKGLSGITYGNNTFVAVGSGGAIVTSPDGATWTERISGVSVNLSHVGYGGNTFIAVGDSGTILTSPDGATWTSRKSQTTVKLRSIIYTGNTFVAVGDTGTALASSDGTAWSSRASGISRNINGVVTGNNTIIVAGDGGAILQSNSFSTCSYTISPAGKTFSTSAGTDTVSVTASLSSCTWTAAVSADASPWLSITSGSSGTGSGTVNYSVSQNTGTSARKGVIIVADQGFRAAQSGTGENVFMITLSGSWDLISSPLELTDTKTPAVFKDVSNNVVVVWEFTPPNTWKSYLPKDYDPGDKSAIHDVSSNKGYWVKTKASDTLVLTGSDPVSRAINLAADWNLTGYKKSTNTPTPIAFKDISGNITVVWEFTPPNTWKSYLPKDYDPGDKSAIHALVPGSGYWMKMNAEVAWTPPAFGVEKMIFTNEALDCQTPVSKSSFTDADLGVTVLVGYRNFEAGKTWKLEWYSPDNTLVKTQSNTLDSGLSSGCSWRSLSREDLRKFGTGQWPVKFYYDGQLYKTASFTYTLTETDIWRSAKISAVPDYYQLDDSYGGFPEGGSMYCAPVSVSNSLMWLANNGFDSLAKNTADRKKDQYDLITDLALLMKTDPTEGSSVVDLLTGAAKYISDKGYKNYQLRYQGWRPCTAESDTGIKVPDMAWIKSGIEGKGSVWLNIAWYTYDKSKDEYNRTGGHWVTLVGSGYNGNPDYLVMHDPITGYTNHYVLPEKITSGTLTGAYTGLPLSAVGYHKMNNRMRIKEDFGILDGAVVLTFN